MAAVIAFISIVASLMTGERINFLIRACGGMFAAFAWKQVWACCRSVGGRVSRRDCGPSGDPWAAVAVLHAFLVGNARAWESAYFRAMAPGAFNYVAWNRARQSSLSLRRGDRRFGSYDCHPHPHNYYIQMMGEAGIAGFVTGVLFCGSIIWACARPAIRNRNNVVVATMWIVPFGFFWPIASSADFFGQWNNLFMWSALAVALAGAQIGSQILTY